MFDFTGQTAIITGGTRGIGKAIAEGFLAGGANVIVTYTSSDESAKKFVEDNKQYEEKIDCQKFDVSDYNQVEEFYRSVIDEYEKIDILVNNAGIRKDAVVAMMKQEDWQRVIDINLTGLYNMCKFAAMNMSSARYGRIINITSPSGKFGFEGQANYAASKAGMIAFTRSLSKEVAKRKITVNCVSPGFIETDLIKDLPEDLVKVYKKQVPMKRFGKPSEVAYCVSCLASKDASYVTGAVFEVTGGL